ncbi:cation diffusion facilitator family transporter [Umboniibacter marinipuniceus]|uniref:Cation-efflux pump FieF n=1 Tax=Umboniibacter marinipuniceus TaxID=569599 RepID=A0A3M0A7N3_9GAMM|nr:cation diffusion facilitator family transporter [Umboniibacter marinipuniceus]RMA78818.1 ferrous-iron efflux pump FieF [Umboniibacter marinipuniceus]
MSEHLITAERREKLLRWVSIASISVAIILVATKLAAWWYSDSVSLMASLIDSVMDAGASLINFLAIRYALKPADDDHRFGHGKAEALASLLQSILIALSSVFLLFYAIDRISNPTELNFAAIAIAVMVLSLFLTISLVLFQRYVVRRTKSTVVSADSLHYLSDILANIAVIVALVLAGYGFKGVDAWLGVVIGIYIAYSAWEIASEAIDLLLDKELDDETRERICEQVRSVPKVIGLHDLRTRDSGGVVFVQMHLELPDQMPLLEAHKIADQVEERVLSLFPKAEVLVHQDPISVVPEPHPLPAEDS